jgi:hypothetical protein
MLKGNDVIWMGAACAVSALIIRPSVAISIVFLSFIGGSIIPSISSMSWQFGGKFASSHTDCIAQHLQLPRLENNLLLFCGSKAF